jgi:hypothetical protein
MGAFVAVTQANCATFTPSEMQAPRGGLTGTMTLINVAKGVDFAVNATALAQLASKPYFRAASDPYPDFNAGEIDPWSVNVQGGTLYRSSWTRPVDAVTVALMTAGFTGEYILDTATRSASEVVVTMPTRHFYAVPGSGGASPPFTALTPWSASCQSTEVLSAVHYDREGLEPSTPDFSVKPAPGFTFPVCSDVFVWSLRRDGQAAGDVSSIVFGSSLRDFRSERELQPGRMNGSFALRAAGATAATFGIRSSVASSSMQLAEGTTATHAFDYLGLPMIGFWVRTFENGTFTCDAGTCQGNYGAAFPLTRSGPTVMPSR